MFAYFKLFLYSCVFCCVVYLILGGTAAAYLFISEGYFFYPIRQIIRACVFGMISGAAITLAAIVFNLIDKFNSHKKPPSDPE